jgi:hypothetical protein
MFLIVSCSNKKAEKEDKMVIEIKQNYGSGDLQDQIFAENDKMLKNKIETKLEELVKEMKIKNSSSIMIKLQTNDNAKYKDWIRSYLAFQSIDLNQVFFDEEEPESNETIEIMME